MLPQGAALSALRGVQYFGDRGIGLALLCLLIWALAGLALLGVGESGPLCEEAITIVGKGIDAWYDALYELRSLTGKSGRHDS